MTSASGLPEPDPATQSSTVALRIPGDAAYLRVARFAAADAASRAGLDVDAIDDMRLAVSELCALLTTADAPITLAFSADDDGVTVEGHGTPGPQLDDTSGELSRVLVEAVVDEYRLDVTDGRASFRIVKHRKGSA